MKRMLATCPYCQENLKIEALRCPSCDIEIKKDFEINRFDKLTEDDYQFLLVFLENRGNLKKIQEKMSISYPTAKKKLDELLQHLNLLNEVSEAVEETITLENLQYDALSTKASDIIKKKLKEHGGHVTVYTARGLPCELYANPDGRSFSSDKLPIKPSYGYDVFDIIVDLLVSQGGRAKKGNGRNYKFGEPGCEETTVVGTVAKYRGSQPGRSVFDPVFVLAAVLEWSDIATNGRGEIVLKGYK